MEGEMDGGREGWRERGLEGERDGGREGWRERGMEGERDGRREDGGREGDKEALLCTDLVVQVCGAGLCSAAAQTPPPSTH